MEKDHGGNMKEKAARLQHRGKIPEALIYQK